MVNQSPREHSPAADERPDVLSGTRPDGAVARLLDAAAAPAEAGPQPGEEPALAAFRASHRTRRIPMFSHPTRAKAAVAATIGAGTLLFAGVGGAAAAGALPDHAQNTVSTVLTGLGLDVPRADDNAGDHPADLGTEDATTEETSDTTEDTTDDTTEESTVETDQADTEDADEPADPEANDHGKAVSSLAHDDILTGQDKGAAVSGLASGGKSKAGEDHGKPEQPGSKAESHKPTTGDDDSTEDSQSSTDDSADDQGEDADDQGEDADDESADDSDEQTDGSSTGDEKSGDHEDAGSQKTRP